MTRWKETEAGAQVEGNLEESDNLLRVGLESKRWRKMLKGEEAVQGLGAASLAVEVSEVGVEGDLPS